MKRCICIFLMLCLLLSACGTTQEAAPTETQPVTTAATEPATTAAPTETETEPVTEPATEETEPPVEVPTVPVNPLTGEQLETPYTGRPVAFSLNNISVCLPQYGLDALDWMFEVETEGGITRCVGILTDPSKAGAIGPIRSCRTYFLNISVSYNAPLFHCGGSFYADNNQYSFTERVDAWDHVNEKAASGYFYRDSNRYHNLGYDWEHTLFTSGELMAAAMADRGYNTTTDTPVSYGYQFSDTVALDGQTANTVTVPFRGGKKTIMEYDAESGLYLAHQYGKDWVDGATGENAAFRNILVITSHQFNNLTEAGNHSFYELFGTGNGYFAVDGKMVPVKWHHEALGQPFQFTLEDGTPITLGVGKTYCAVIDDTGVVTAQ